MAKNQNVEHVILDMIDSAFRTVKTVPLNLGGFGGAGGGIGQPPGGYIGQLPQIRVAYDSTEAETLFTPLSGMSLVDNLNHIRYRINDLEENGASPLIVDDWDGVPTVTNVTEITFSGGAIVTQLGTGHVLVQITASGGSSFTGDANSVVLTDGAGALDTMGWIKWGGSAGAQYIELGADVVGKDTNAGKIGYDTFGAGFLYIVGAGASSPRNVKIFDDMYVDGNLFVNGGQAILAGKQVTNGDSHDHLGGDGNQINHTSLLSIGTNTHAQIDTHIATGSHVTNGDSHDHSGGDGGTISFPTLSNLPLAESNANDIYRNDVASAGTTAFVGTIATLPGGAVLTYNVSSGNENALVPTSTSQLAKMRLYNTTRGTHALISNCVVGTNTITLTATVTAGWLVGDTITIASQTVSGGTGNWVDLEITSGLVGKSAIFANCHILDSVASAATILRYHPFESFSSSKIQLVPHQVATFTTAGLMLIKLTNNMFTISAITSGAASITIRQAGYLY